MSVNQKSASLFGVLMPHPPILIPEIGKGREKGAKMTDSSCRKVASRIASLKPETIVVISPHAPLFRDYLFVYDAPVLTGSFSRFGASSVSFSHPEDEDFVRVFKTLLSAKNIPGGTPDPEALSRFEASDTLDHGVLVPLHYIDESCADYRLVCLSCSAFDIDRVLEIGQSLALAAQKTGRSVCILASGDMSHKVNIESPYGAVKEGEIFDSAIADAIRNNDLPSVLSIDPLVRERAAECGYNSLVMLAGALSSQGSPGLPDARGITCVFHSMEAPFGIGYCVAEFSSGGNHE
jgi:aromatic ring-opening dioxygenase LigB subunit